VRGGRILLKEKFKSKNVRIEKENLRRLKRGRTLWREGDIGGGRTNVTKGGAQSIQGKTRET